MAKNCPYCGCPTSANDKFCNKCGHKLPWAHTRSKSQETRDNAYQSNSIGKTSIDTSPAESNYDSDAYVPDRGLWQKFFTFKGRLNPARYVFRTIVLFFLVYIGSIIGMIICNALNLQAVGSIFVLPLMVVPILVFPLSVRRAHDMGRSGWWAIFGVLPIIGAALEMCFRKIHWVDRWGDHHEDTRLSDVGMIGGMIYFAFASVFAALYFTFRSGMQGENEYGPDPKSENRADIPPENNRLLKMITDIEEGDHPTLKMTGVLVALFFAFGMVIPFAQNLNFNTVKPASIVSSPKIERPVAQPAAEVGAVSESVKQMIEATPPPVVEQPPQPQVVAQPLTNDNQRAAVQTLASFHEEITKKNFQGAYNCFSRDMQSEISYDGWVPGFGTTVSSSVSDVRIIHESPNAIELSYILTAIDNINGRESTAQFNGTATLINEGGQWKLDFIKNKVR